MRGATTLPKLVSPQSLRDLRARRRAAPSGAARRRPACIRPAVVDRGARVGAGAPIGPHAVDRRAARSSASARAIGAGMRRSATARRSATTSLLHRRVTVYDALRRRRAHASCTRRGDRRRRLRHGRGRRRWLKIPQVGRVVVGADVRDRRQHDDRPRRDRRHGDRGRRQARQPDPDRPQLPRSARTRRSPAASGIAGSTRIGRNCRIGGAAMIAGHIDDRRRDDRLGGDAACFASIDDARRLHGASSRRCRTPSGGDGASQLRRLRALAGACRGARARAARRATTKADARDERMDDAATSTRSCATCRTATRSCWSTASLELRAGQVASRAHQERDVNEPFFQGHFPRLPGDARRADHRGAGAGLGDRSPAGPIRPRRAARKLFLLRRHRRRALQAPGGARRPAACSKSTCSRIVRGIGKFAVRATVDGEIAAEADAAGGAAPPRPARTEPRDDGAHPSHRARRPARAARRRRRGRRRTRSSAPTSRSARARSIGPHVVITGRTTHRRAQPHLPVRVDRRDPAGPQVRRRADDDDDRRRQRRSASS